MHLIRWLNIAALIAVSIYFSRQPSAVVSLPLRERPPPLEAGATDVRKACHEPPVCDGDCSTLLLLIQGERRKSTWLDYYMDISKEVTRLGHDRGVFVEIGVAYGGLSLAMLELNPELTVVAVDPFLGGYDPRDSMSDLFRDLQAKYGSKFSGLWARALFSEAVARFGCRYRLINNRSEEAAATFSPRSIDVVFIDGDHQQEGVQRDIKAWKHIVKPGHTLMFNDYQADRWPGVVFAVDQHAKETGQQPWYIGQRSWGNVGLINKA